jgi:hypothetical protein
MQAALRFFASSPFFAYFSRKCLHLSAIPESTFVGESVVSQIEDNCYLSKILPPQKAAKYKLFVEEMTGLWSVLFNCLYLLRGDRFSRGSQEHDQNFSRQGVEFIYPIVPLGSEPLDYLCHFNYNVRQK